MFATIIGPYPGIAGASSEGQRLEAVLGDQLEAGLGILSDGRVHAVTGASASVVSAWRAADEVGHHLAAINGLEPPLIKACLVGPWTMGEGDPASVRAAAERLVPAIADLFAAGAPVVQVTEPAIGSIDGADGPSIALLSEVLERLASSASGPGHVSLALVGGGQTAVPAERLVVGFASYLFDLIASPDDWRVCATLPGESGLIAGVVDPRPGRSGVVEVGVWGARYAASMGGRGSSRTGICPGSGLERLDREGARAVLALAAQVARDADMPDQELVRQLDPLAVDARSAALGHGELRPRRPPRT